MFPISLNLGFRFIPFYEGLYFLIAILTAALWALRRWKSAGLSQESYDSILLAGIGGAILGGRLSHFLFWEPARLIDDPLSFFRVWEGGISVSGGVLLGILAAWIVSRVKKLDFWKILEVSSPAVLLGQAVGRIGCFLNGDAFGKPTSMPWGISFRRFATLIPGFKPDRRLSGPAWQWCAQRGLLDLKSEWSLPMHPTQLYEGALDILLLFLLLFAMKRLDGSRRGKLGLLSLTGGYALIRFSLEFLRADNDGPVVLGMTVFQLVLLGLFILSAVISPFMLRKEKATQA